MTREKPVPRDAGYADVELVDAAGHHILIECKVRESEPKRRDFESSRDRLNQAKSEGKDLEVWFFNIERLKLKVMRLDGSSLQLDNLVPLNVWERTPDGIFEHKSSSNFDKHLMLRSTVRNYAAHNYKMLPREAKRVSVCWRSSKN